MNHKLKKGETFKVADSTPHYLEAIYDSSSCTIRAHLDGQKIDWDKVEDIDAGKGRFFFKNDGWDNDHY
ncbi:hypothetical protein OAK67_02720 [Crocinitomicaceae bacterium]|nr:hypothetical protein [Crocinitomicaceae bacterium]